MNAASEMDMSVICPHDGHRCKMDEDMIQKYNSILNQYCRMLGLGQLIILVFFKRSSQKPVGIQKIMIIVKIPVIFCRALMYLFRGLSHMKVK